MRHCGSVFASNMQKRNAEEKTAQAATCATKCASCSQFLAYCIDEIGTAHLFLISKSVAGLSCIGTMKLLGMMHLLFSPSSDTVNGEITSLVALAADRACNVSATRESVAEHAKLQ